MHTELKMYSGRATGMSHVNVLDANLLIATTSNTT